MFFQRNLANTTNSTSIQFPTKSFPLMLPSRLPQTSASYIWKRFHVYQINPALRPFTVWASQQMLYGPMSRSLGTNSNLRLMWLCQRRLTTWVTTMTFMSLMKISIIQTCSCNCNSSPGQTLKMSLTTQVSVVISLLQNFLLCAIDNSMYFTDTVDQNTDADNLVTGAPLMSQHSEYWYK